MTEQGRSLARESHHDVLDDKHPDRPTRVEQVHGVLVELIEVKRVDPLFSPHQDVLVVRLRMNPTCRAVDIEGTSVEHFRKACAHMHLWSGRKPIAGCFWRRSGPFL